MKFVSIERFIHTSSDILEFIVDLKIVEDIIAQLFFRPNDDLDTLSDALLSPLLNPLEGPTM
jgi:hypothetical protein